MDLPARPARKVAIGGLPIWGQYGRTETRDLRTLQQRGDERAVEQRRIGRAVGRPYRLAFWSGRQRVQRYPGAGRLALTLQRNTIRTRKIPGLERSGRGRH